MLAEDPADRPSDAREVLELLGRDARRHSFAAAPRLLAREREIAAFEAWFEALRQGQPGQRLLSVYGAPGTGTTRLTRELLWRAQLSVRVLRAQAHEAAHGWFGNGVRLRCWEDFVLSEGTASYLAARVLEEVAGPAVSEPIWGTTRARRAASTTT